jgi:hypothetical protein
MQWLTGLFDFLAKPVTSYIEGSQARKYLKEEGKLQIAKAKVALEVQKYTTEAERLANSDIADADYDKQVQLERRHTIIDEVLIIWTLILATLHFIPMTQPYMAEGWKAMGYKGVPYWFEFAIVGIYIATLGLMRLFKFMFSVKEKFSKGEDKNVSKE